MEENRKIITEKDAGFVNTVLYKYLPYWPLFLLLVILSIGGAISYLRYKTPIYKSTARILIKDERKGTEDTRMVEDINQLSTKKIIENEVEVIQSNTLVNEVVNALHLYAPVYEERKFTVNPAYLSSPILVEVKDPSKIVASKKIYFTVDKEKSEVIVNSRRYPMNQWVQGSSGAVRYISNPRFQAGTNHPLFYSLVRTKDVSLSIQNRLKVSTASKLSSILDLTLTDEIAERGEDILNELLTTYNTAMVNDKNELARNTLSFVEERLANVERDLSAIERKTEQYKSKKGAINIGEQGKLFLQNVSINDQKLSEINMQMAVLNQVENYVNAKNNAGGIVPSTLGVADPLLSQLVDKLFSAELEYGSLKNTTGENDPSMIALNDKINKIKPGILENIQSQRRSLEASKFNLASTNNAYSSMLQSMPEKERELIDINREQNIKNQIYAFLLQKKEETALSHASRVSDSRIVDHASSLTDPVSPKKKVVYLSALLIGLLSGFGIVTVREKFSRKIMFRHEIERATNRPIIGEIVSESSKDVIVIDGRRRTFIAEQFRKLRLTVKELGINSKKKRILITSSISGEGKSFVAINLALSMALTNKKVVLVDGDLNNPSLIKKLNLADHIGVAEYLRGECEVEDIIRPSGVHENLFVVSTGELPANPSELILNGQIENLLNELDGRFDSLVIDSAPVIPVTDAYILSPYCDATIYIVRHKYTPKVFIERLDENNKLNHLNNLGIVFNGVQPRGFGSRNYGYGYGYGYIYNDKENRNRLRISNT